MSNVDSIKNIADSVLKKSTVFSKYAAVFIDWASVVGHDISTISIPHKITNIGAEKILVLKVKKGCSVELQHSTEKILDLVHNFLGEKVFSRIKVIQMDVNEKLTNT
jgi:hypothetical protein